MSVKGIEVSGKVGRALLDLLDKKECDKKKVSEHKMSAEHKKLWKEYKAKAKTAIELRDEADILRKKFWNKVEGDLEMFDKDLKVNIDDGLIEVYECDCDDDDK